MDLILIFYFKDEAEDEEIGMGVTLKELKEGLDFYLSNLKYIDTIGTISLYEMSTSTNIRESTTKKRIKPKK